MPRRVRTQRVLGVLVLLASLILTFAAPVSAAQGRLKGSFQGEAWGTNADARIGPIQAELGKTAYVPCGCHGTGGLISNTKAAIQVGNVLQTGVLVSTAQAAKDNAMGATARTTSRVANVSALGGLVRVDALEAIATVNATSTSVRASADGSSIATVVVNGVSHTVSRDERIDVPGFGYVAFYLVSGYGNGQTTGGVRIDMMRIVITRENVLGLPISSVINVGHAEVGYTREDPGPRVSAAAWGTEANATVGSDIGASLGRSAVTYLVCFGSGQRTTSNKTNSLSVPGIVRSGLNVNDITASVTASLSIATARSRIENLNLLNGLIRADVVRAVASARSDSAGPRTSFEGSRFVNLRVLGIRISDNPAPNTKITIPGVGTLTLFATSAWGDAHFASGTVEMLLLKVTQPNVIGLPVGSEIRIARAGAMVGG